VYDNTAYAPGSQLPIDGSPGATNPFTVDFNIPTINTGFPLVGIFGIIGYISVHVNGTPTNFTFVPAVSALDVTPFNTTSFSVQFVNGTNQNFPSTSETFIAQETNANAGTTNNAHIRFTARNARWLFNEMESIANTENCSAECSNPYYIKGNDIVCSSYIFTIPGYPRGSFVSWSVSPSNIASIQANGSTAILTQTGNGTVTITASIGACGQNGPLTKNIQVGPPATPSLSYNYDAQCGTFAEAYSTTPTGATGHVWNLNYGQIIQDIDGYGSNYFYYAPLVNNPQQGQTYFNYLTVQAKNSCGLSDASPTSSMTVGPVPSNCDGGGGPILLRVSPNPTTSTANVEALQNTSFIKLRIMDRFGNVKKELVYTVNTKRAVISLNDLSTGFYFVKAFDGTIWRTVSFIKL